MAGTGIARIGEGRASFAGAVQVVRTVTAGGPVVAVETRPLPRDSASCGNSGNGLTHSTVAGMLLSDLIAGRDNRWASLYHPDRFKWRAAPRVLRENANVALQFAKSYVDLHDSPGVDDIAPGQGAIVRNGLVKSAVFRDEDGAQIHNSAQCPHLGCLVAWNPVQRTWDCPCHGSKFDCYGRIINGPADRNLHVTEEAGTSRAETRE